MDGGLLLGLTLMVRPLKFVPSDITKDCVSRRELVGGSKCDVEMVLGRGRFKLVVGARDSNLTFAALRLS